MNIYLSLVSFSVGVAAWLSLQYLTIKIRGPAVVKGSRTAKGAISFVLFAAVVSAVMIFLMIDAYLGVVKSSSASNGRDYLLITILIITLVLLMLILFTGKSLYEYRKNKDKHIFYCIPFADIQGILSESATKVTGGKTGLFQKNQNEFILSMSERGEVRARKVHYGKALVEFILPNAEFRGQYLLEVRAALLRKINDSSAPIRFD